MLPRLTTRQSDALVWFMHWVEEHCDDQGRRQYPTLATITAYFGPWLINSLMNKGYLTYATDCIQPTPRAEKWWMERQGARRRLVVELDKD